ncbi:MAG: NifB/NifX family molybdenum-iron cluster-binding protein, partial [Deltaproteobacteria bacterium]|nr:NifB/NifX family molybdenum-iron cluster-binding protein [Deltaproteobacteria bacterium]
MRIAMTIWEGRISPVFDVSREALVLEIDHGTEISRRSESLATPDPSAKVGRLKDLGVETLVCGAISEPLRRELDDHGVRVIGFVAGAIEPVVQALLLDTLPHPALSMPGCGARNERPSRT